MTKSPGNSQPDQARPFDTTGWLLAMSYLTSGTKTNGSTGRGKFKSCLGLQVEIDTPFSSDRFESECVTMKTY